MKNSNKLIILWGLTIIGMILHFNYHIGGIFYGIDIVKPGSKGTEPNSLLVIRTLFYHLPIVWILLILYVEKRWVDISLFVISILYLLAHASHFAGEVFGKEKNPSQLSLLFVVLIVASLLAFEHYKTIRKNG